MKPLRHAVPALLLVALRAETAVGLGAGVWGDRKKVSADSSGGRFRAEDRLPAPGGPTTTTSSVTAAAASTAATSRCAA